jgi:hypothetical protein
VLPTHSNILPTLIKIFCRLKTKYNYRWLKSYVWHRTSPSEGLIFKKTFLGSWQHCGKLSFASSCSELASYNFLSRLVQVEFWNLVVPIAFTVYQFHNFALLYNAELSKKNGNPTQVHLYSRESIVCSREITKSSIIIVSTGTYSQFNTLCQHFL